MRISHTAGMKRIVAGGALAVFIAAMAAVAISSATSGGGGSASSPATTAATTTTPPVITTAPVTTAPAPKPVRVKLTAVGAYDPEGDQHENDSLAPLAVDGDPTTYWKTEHYTNGFFKKGVGLVLDAGSHRTISTVVVSTDGAGVRAQIELGDDPAGPFTAVSPVKALSGRTAFALRKGAAGRYVVVWITALPAAIGEGHVTEVTALASAS